MHTSRVDSELASLSRQIDAAELGRRIRYARIAAGLTQRQLAGTETTASYISRIEDGQRRPSNDLLELFAERTDTTVEALLLGGRNKRDEWRLALDYAELALIAGNAASALADATTIAGQTRVMGDTAMARSADFIRAGALEALGDLDAAITVLEELAAVPETGPRWVKAHIALVRCHAEQGALTRAVAVGEAALPRLEDAGLADLTEAIQLRVTIAGVYKDLGEIDHAMRLCQRAIADAERVASPVAKASAYWNASLVASSRGEHEAALEAARIALATFEQADDARNLGRLRTQVADLHLRTTPPDPDQAKAELLRATRELDWSSATPIDSAEHHLVLGQAQLMLGEYDVARRHFEEAKRLAGDRAPLICARTSAQEGQLACRVGTPQEARAHYEAATEWLLAAGADRAASRLWFELAAQLDALGDKDGSLDAYRRGVAASGLGAAIPSVLSQQRADVS